MKSRTIARIGCAFAVGLLFCICQVASATPIITITTLTSYSGMDLSGNGVVLAVGNALPAGQTITVGNVTFQSINAYKVGSNPGYTPYTMTGGNNGQGWGAVWGTAPSLGTDSEDFALAQLLHYSTSSSELHRLGVLPNTTYTWQEVFLNTYNNTGTSNFSIKDTNNSVVLASATNIPDNLGPHAFSLMTITFNTGSNSSIVWGSSGSCNGSYILSVTPTPEPTTVGLLVLGGIGSLLRRRK